MKDIRGYENLYAITSCGKVWSYRKQKFLKPGDNGHGYQFVILCKDGVSKRYKIHRLVAEAYIPNPEGKTDVDHINQNKAHNYVQNLRWATRSENIRHSFKLKKIEAAPVLCVELNKVFPTMRSAAKFAGIHRQGITNCVRGKQKTAGGYHWEYAAAANKG